MNGTAIGLISTILAGVATIACLVFAVMHGSKASAPASHEGAPPRISAATSASDDMTLVVSVHRRDPDSGELGPDLVTAAGAELAGFEAWRSSVYGTAALNRRGAQFLSELVDGDLIVEGNDLVAFRQECAHLLRVIVELSSEVHVDVETLRFRLSNIAAAIELAIAVGGVVWIS